LSVRACVRARVCVCLCVCGVCMCVCVCVCVCLCVCARVRVRVRVHVHVRVLLRLCMHVVFVCVLCCVVVVAAVVWFVVVCCVDGLVGMGLVWVVHNEMAHRMEARINETPRLLASNDLFCDEVNLHCELPGCSIGASHTNTCGMSSGVLVLHLPLFRMNLGRGCLSSWLMQFFGV